MGHIPVYGSICYSRSPIKTDCTPTEATPDVREADNVCPDGIQDILRGQPLHGAERLSSVQSVPDLTQESADPSNSDNTIAHPFCRHTWSG